MNLSHDYADSTTSIAERLRKAKSKYELAKARLDGTRARLLKDPEEEKWLISGAWEHRDVWGQVTKYPPEYMVVRNDAERTLLYRQYLRDFEWYLRCMLEYERLQKYSRDSDFGRPVLTPGQAPEDKTRGPLGVGEQAKSASAASSPLPKKQEAALKVLEESIRKAAQERSKKSIRRVLLDMANAQRAGADEDPRMEKAWSTIGDIAEENVEKALRKLRANPTRKNVARTLSETAEAQMVGRDPPQVWPAIGGVLEDLASRAAQILRANPTRKNVKSALQAAADAQMAGGESSEAMDAASDVADDLAQRDVADFRKNPSARQFGKSLVSEGDAQMLGRGLNTDLFDVGPHRLKAPGKYKVKAGDSLSKIALKFYGDASRWPPIYLLNIKVIGKNPRVIQVGITLEIP